MLSLYLGFPALPEDGSSDRLVLDQAVAAVNELVPRTVPRVKPVDGVPVDPWPADVENGALIMGARFFTRRRSPTGVATYDETGPTYIARWDPDLERMLGIGQHEPPGTV